MHCTKTIIMYANVLNVCTVMIEIIHNVSLSDFHCVANVTVCKCRSCWFLNVTVWRTDATMFQISQFIKTHWMSAFFCVTFLINITCLYRTGWMSMISALIWLVEKMTLGIPMTTQSLWAMSMRTAGHLANSGKNWRYTTWDITCLTH